MARQKWREWLEKNSGKADDTETRSTPPSSPKKTKSRSSPGNVLKPLSDSGAESKSDNPRGITVGGGESKTDTSRKSPELRQHVQSYEGAIPEKKAKECLCAHFVGVLRNLFQGGTKTFKNQVLQKKNQIDPEVLAIIETNPDVNILKRLREAWNENENQIDLTVILDNLDKEGVSDENIRDSVFNLKQRLCVKIDEMIPIGQRKGMKAKRDAIVLMSMLERVQKYDKKGRQSQNFVKTQFQIIKALDCTKEQVNTELSVNEMTVEETEKRQQINAGASALLDFLGGFAGVVVDKADKVATANMILSLSNKLAVPAGQIFTMFGFAYPAVGVIGTGILTASQVLGFVESKITEVNTVFLEKSLGACLTVLSVVGYMLKRKQRSKRYFWNPYNFTQQLSDAVSFEALTSFFTLGASNLFTNWIIDNLWLTNSDLLEGTFFTHPVFTLAVQPAMTLALQYIIGLALPSSKQERQQLRQNIMDSLVVYSGREAVTTEARDKIIQDISLAYIEDQKIQDTKTMRMAQRLRYAFGSLVGNRVLSQKNMVLTVIMSPGLWLFQQMVNGDGYANNAQCTVTATSLYCSGDADHNGMQVQFTDIYDALLSFDQEATDIVTEEGISGRVRDIATKLLNARNSRVSPVMSLSDTGMVLQAYYKSYNFYNSVANTNTAGFLSAVKETVTNVFFDANATVVDNDVENTYESYTTSTFVARFTGSPLPVSMTHAEVNDIRQFVETYGTQGIPDIDQNITLIDEVDAFRDEVDNFVNASDYELVGNAQQRSNTLQHVRVMRKQLSSGFSRYRYVSRTAEQNRGIFDTFSQRIKDWWNNDDTQNFFNENNVNKVRQKLVDKQNRLEETDRALRELDKINDRSLRRSPAYTALYRGLDLDREDLFTGAFVTMLDPPISEDYDTVTRFLNKTLNTTEWWKSPVLSDAVDKSVALVGQKNGTFEYGPLAEDYRKDLERQNMSSNDIEQKLNGVGEIIRQLNEDREEGSTDNSTANNVTSESKENQTSSDPDVQAIKDAKTRNDTSLNDMSLDDTPQFGDEEPDIQEKIDQMQKNDNTANNNNSWWSALANGISSLGKLKGVQPPLRPPRIDYTDYTASVHGVHQISYSLAHEGATKQHDEHGEDDEQKQGGLAYLKA